MSETVSKVAFPVEEPAPKRKMMSVLPILAGVGSIITPFASSYIVQTMPMSDLTLFNSGMLLILSVLLMVFLVISCFNNLFNKHFKLFALGVIILILGLISFMWNLINYLKL